jgi:hypothetical protein
MDWLDLGCGTYVKREEVVAIHEGYSRWYDDFEDDWKLQTERRLAVQPFAEGMRAVVVLRDGSLMPAYVSAKTVVKRLNGG